MSNPCIFKIMPKYIRLIIIFLILGFCVIHKLEASGLSTGFSEVTLENLETGHVYRTKETANLPLVVVNTGNLPIDLKIELILPQPAELKEGYEPIPDLSWIKFEQADFKEVKLNDSAISDVIIAIPNDKKYQGKKYQVFIWSHTTGTKIGLGLKSKLLFTIK